MNNLEVARTIVRSLDDLSLNDLHKRLKRTRRHTFCFGVNGREVVVSRRQAIDMVISELLKRPCR